MRLYWYNISGFSLKPLLCLGIGCRPRVWGIGEAFHKWKSQKDAPAPNQAPHWSLLCLLGSSSWKLSETIRNPGDCESYIPTTDSDHFNSQAQLLVVWSQAGTLVLWDSATSDATRDPEATWTWSHDVNHVFLCGSLIKMIKMSSRSMPATSK